MIASLDGTALSAQDYLAHLRRDGAAFRRALTGVAPTTSVPTCADWTVSDLVDHLAAVYAHKSASILTGSRPVEGSWATQPPEGTDALAWFDEELAAVDDVLSARPSRRARLDLVAGGTSRSASGQRRMAQETVIHRVDAEASAGAVTPVDEELAVDGIDELLGWMTFPFDTPGLDGGRVRVSAGGHAWVVELTAGAVTARGASGDTGPVDAEVSGAPGDLLLHLWGRRSVARPGRAVRLGSGARRPRRPARCDDGLTVRRLSCGRGRGRLQATRAATSEGSTGREGTDAELVAAELAVRLDVEDPIVSQRSSPVPRRPRCRRSRS